jgi:hypothetical protein
MPHGQSAMVGLRMKMRRLYLLLVPMLLLCALAQAQQKKIKLSPSEQARSKYDTVAIVKRFLRAAYSLRPSYALTIDVRYCSTDAPPEYFGFVLEENCPFHHLRREGPA